MVTNFRNYSFVNFASAKKENIEQNMGLSLAVMTLLLLLSFTPREAHCQSFGKSGLSRNRQRQFFLRGSVKVRHNYSTDALLNGRELEDLNDDSDHGGDERHTDDGNDNNLSTGQIVLIVVLSVVFFCAAMVVCCFFQVVCCCFI